MSKRLQVVFNDEAWSLVEKISTEASEGFEVGSISYSDIINEMVIHSKVDVKGLQLKHTDFRRSLKHLASKEDVDLDLVIKSLLELKSKTSRRSTKNINGVAEVID
jgi:hypothetical protein